MRAFPFSFRFPSILVSATLFSFPSNLPFSSLPFLFLSFPSIQGGGWGAQQGSAKFDRQTYSDVFWDQYNTIHALEYTNSYSPKTTAEQKDGFLSIILHYNISSILPNK